MILTPDQILDDQAVNGDHYRLTYRSKVPVFRAGQAQLLINRLKDQDKRIANITATVKEDLIVVDFDVVKNPFPLVAILTAVSVLAGGLFLVLSLERVEKISRSPFGWGLLVVAGIVGWTLLKKEGVLK